MNPLSTAQANVMAALAAQRRTFSGRILDCYDGRTVGSLIDRGLLETVGGHDADAWRLTDAGREAVRACSRRLKRA